MSLFEDLARSLGDHRDRNAFWLNGAFHTYEDLIRAVSRIRAEITRSIPAEERIIGLVANDDLETYASILALWFEGRAYVPIAPGTPMDRNRDVISQAGIVHLLASATTQLQQAGCMVIRTDELGEAEENLNVLHGADGNMVYMLFTSGTTGSPKGVPITAANLSSFVDAFWALGIPIEKEDRCLQMFELTFDVSVMSYLLPLLRGACAFTVSKNEIKYAFIAELLEDHQLTHALLVPSVINYLRPYFPEIHAPALRYAMFAGEALPLDITQEWARCVPNASIRNMYGPTEFTIVCTNYTLSRTGPNGSHHGVLSIGGPMQGSTLVVVDDALRILEDGNTGELCLAGPQLTAGYWNDAEKTRQAFFTATHNGRPMRFYRTGDLCRIDKSGDILYLGRLDQQTKVQGYRVELPEIEHYARTFFARNNAVALGVPNAVGNTEIALLIESGEELATKELISFLRSKLPPYMIPTTVRYMACFPLNTSGKTDRRALREMVHPIVT